MDMPSLSTPQRHPPGRGSPLPASGARALSPSHAWALTAQPGAGRLLDANSDARAPARLESSRGSAGTAGTLGHAGVGDWRRPRDSGGHLRRRAPERASPPAATPPRDFALTFRGGGGAAGPGRAGSGLTCAQIVVDPQGHPQDVDQEEHEEEPHGPQIGPRPHDAGLELLQEARARLGHLPALLRTAAALAGYRDDSPARGTARAAAARARRPRVRPAPGCGGKPRGLRCEPPPVAFVERSRGPGPCTLPGHLYFY